MTDDLSNSSSAIGAATPVSSRERRAAWLPAVLLVLVTVVLYWPAVHCGFVGYDDPLYVTSNHQVQTGLTPGTMIWAFTTGASANWHPVTWLSLLLDRTMFGTGPAGFHATNVVLHALDAVLLFWLLWHLTGAYWRSAAVAALFAWHPLHVESVAWISERKDVLSAGFGFLALLFWGAGARRQEAGGRMAEYFASLFFFALGLMSKPMLVTWPFVLLLLDWWPLGRWQGVPGRGDKLSPPRGWRQLAAIIWPLLREKIPFFGLSVMASIVTFLVQRQGGAVVPEGSLPLGARIGNALISYCRYLGKIFWPANLSVLYTQAGYWPAGEVVLAGLFLAGVSALFWVKRRSHPYLLVGWLWYVGTLVPVIGLVQVGEQAMADRYAYIPSVGILIVVVWGVVEVAGRWAGTERPERGSVTRSVLPADQGLVTDSASPGSRPAAAGPVDTAALRGRGALAALAVLSAVAAIACCVLTREQLGYWRNGEVLFRHALATGENSYTVHGNLGAALLEEGQTDAAITELKEAIYLKSSQALAHADLGVAFTRKGQIDTAISQLREAIRLKPDYEEAHYNLGLALMDNNDAGGAMGQFQAALQLDSADAEAHNKLGLTLATQGQTDPAISHYHEAIRLKPDFAEAHYNLGTALIGLGNTDAAIAEFQEAIRLQPDYAPAHNNLGIILTRKGSTDAAISEFQEALRLEPNYTKAQSNLAMVLALKKKLEARTPAPPK